MKGLSVNAPAHKNKAGCVFVGWKDFSTGSIYNGSVTASGDMMLTATYAECVLVDGEELSFGAGGTGFDIDKYVVDGNGLYTVRYTVPEEGGTYDNAVQNGTIAIKKGLSRQGIPHSCNRVQIKCFKC